MSDVFRLKAIKPKQLQVKSIRLGILNELRGEGKDLKKEFDKTVSTWDGDKPDFTPNISLTSREAGVTVSPTGNKKAVMKWTYLDQGTSIRWAVMSNNWKSKTKPGRLQSSGGAGKPVVVGRKAMQKRNIPPRPGIKARGWSKTIQRQNTRRFPKRIGLAIKRARKF